MNTSGSTTWRLGRDFLADVAAFRPRLLAALSLVTLLSSLMEMATFTVLVPLLGMIGIVPTSEGGGSIEALVGYVSGVIGGPPTLEGALALFLCLIVLRSALGYLSALLSAHYVSSRADHIRRRVYTAFSRASWLHLTSTRRSHDTHALTMLAENAGYAVQYLIMLISATILAASGVVLAYLVSPRLTATVLVASLALAVPLAILHASAYQRGKYALGAMQRLYDVLGSRMNGIKLAKAFSIERELEQDFTKASASYRLAMLAMREGSARARLLQDLAAAVILVVFVFVSVRGLAVPSLELILLIAICARVLPLVNTVQLTVRSLAGALPNYDTLRMQETLARAAAEPCPKDPQRIGIRSAIEIRGVNFAYPSNPDLQVLRDVNLKIPARTAMAIIGISGAGKSTLADIVAGLIAPVRGALFVDGELVTAERRSHWRSGVIYVPQDAPLFHDTIRANLNAGAPRAMDTEIWQCLELVHAANFVRHLPGGLDAVVGDRGVRLSGGQRQRVRLASALLRNPELLILDEATNALSPADEQEIVTALRGRLDTSTIIVIAHRTSSVIWTDQTVVLSHGRVVSSGPTRHVITARGEHRDDVCTRHNCVVSLSFEDLPFAGEQAHDHQ